MFSKKKCFICESLSRFSKKVYGGYICRNCLVYIPSHIQIKHTDKDDLKAFYKEGKERAEHFEHTSSYGKLFIDSTHGSFCISQRVKGDKPLHLGDIFFVTELLEVALYCTNVRKVGSRNNISIVCDIRLRVKTDKISKEFIVKRAEKCSFTFQDNQIEWKEPDQMTMFRNIFNQMIDNVRFALLKKLDDIQTIKKAIKEYDEDTEWAIGILFLDKNDLSLERIKKHRNILIKQFHPDLFPNSESVEFATKINKAYNILIK